MAAANLAVAPEAERNMASIYSSRYGSLLFSRFIPSGPMRPRLRCTRACRIPVRFLAAAKELLTHPVEGLRAQEID